MARKVRLAEAAGHAGLELDSFPQVRLAMNVGYQPVRSKSRDDRKLLLIVRHLEPAQQDALEDFLRQHVGFTFVLAADGRAKREDVRGDLGRLVECLERGEPCDPSLEVGVVRLTRLPLPDRTGGVDPVKKGKPSRGVVPVEEVEDFAALQTPSSWRSIQELAKTLGALKEPASLRGAPTKVLADTYKAVQAAHKRQVVPVLQEYLRSLEGHGIGSIEEKRGFVKTLRALLRTLDLHVECATCREPSLPVIHKGSSKDGSFGFRHSTAQTSHGGKTTLPRLKLVPAVDRRRTS